MKDIKGYEGLYAITSCGKVYSYRNKIFLKPSKDKNGYLMVCLYQNGKSKTHKIHRLVAEAYIPNITNKPTVNHKDEIKTHNWVGNLEWMTMKENNNYGTRIQRQKESAPKYRKSKNAFVYCIELNKYYLSQRMAEKETGICAHSIGVVLRGKGKTAGGYHWEYREVKQYE